VADTIAATGLTPQQWDEKFFTEFVHQNPFAKYMGTSTNSIIQVKEDLTKKRGDSLTYALVNRLTNTATTGSDTLEGNEEDLTSRSFRVYINKRRNAVRTAEMEEIKSAIPLREAGKEALMNWMQELSRDRIIAALGSINGVAYASASEGQKDAWLVDNADRVLFGALRSNGSSNDHSTSLANIDNTDDKLTPDASSLMKEMAMSIASPKVRPIRSEDGKWFYMGFTGTRNMRNLRANSTIRQAQREVSVLAQNMKLFEGGDVLWDNVLWHEVPDIGVITGVGAGGIDVQPAYLCGAQALAMAIGKRTWTVAKDFDYDDKRGVAVNVIDGIEKMIFGSGTGDTDDLKQHGLVTGYFAAVASA
jgi:N4-gp56 family major capsid protein